ncbi:hypothetical protein Asppvi_001862 [Aspergillus pseudoviridinutans]|uniref:C2H2-type domain-containing protein n=1 Tax=Aspergillus pseudoviridinutans TaxID=1517512 RepID=A0A9P3BLA9_9EURO|nr:uncharacterized protein Asppvi_001862 [Aspergillus pseudoviridinutans]GIJ92584.1 hypothetical protein Asppvi_001862 [Aspergillus pseudoviridinutans]
MRLMRVSGTYHREDNIANRNPTYEEKIPKGNAHGLESKEAIVASYCDSDCTTCRKQAARITTLGVARMLLCLSGYVRDLNKDRYIPEWKPVSLVLSTTLCFEEVADISISTGMSMMEIRPEHRLKTTQQEVCHFIDHFNPFIPPSKGLKLVDQMLTLSIERSAECGIIPGNQDRRSLLGVDLEDVYLQALRGPLAPFTTLLEPAQGNNFDLSEISVDSGLGPDGRESPKATIYGEEYDCVSNSCLEFLHDSHGKYELNADFYSADIPISQTYLCNLCDESAWNIFYSFSDFKRHKETKHETTDHIQQPPLPMPKKAVSKATNRFQEPSTPSKPGHDLRVSLNANVTPSQKIDLPSLNKGIRSPLGSDTTDSGDSEMYADEESLFDDQDAHLYTGRKWNELTIHRLERIYKQKLYSLVGSRVLQHCNPHREYGTSSGHVAACSFQPGPKDGTSSGGKRKPDEISHQGNHGDHDDSNGDGDGIQEPSKRFKVSKSEDRPLRFACPFFKRHPESFRTCGMSDHENSSRVKQHISRKHRMPIYCPRCSETFKTEHDRDTHARDVDCPVGPKANFVCATADQLRKLSKRNTRQTDRENWNTIYKILFPEDPLPESPYLDPLVSYEVNLVREAFLAAAPVAVRTAIQHVIPEEFSDALEEELERVLRSTHAEVFDQIFRRMREYREPAQVHRLPIQSLLQIRMPSTPDSGIGSTVRSGSSQDEPQQTTNSQDMATSFSSGSLNFHNDEAIPFLPLFTPGFDSFEHHIGCLSRSLQDAAFDDLPVYLNPSGASFLTDQS